jgi:phage/plasmid-associated DNA primase
LIYLVDNKRFIIYREPDETQEINIATMKEITGGSALNARLCNSNDTNIEMKGTHILEANKRLGLNGRIDDAIVRRLIDIHFQASFVKNIDEYKGCENVYEGNDYVKTEEYRDKHKYALFHILIEKFISFYTTHKEDIEKLIPKSVKVRTMDYYASVDKFKMWFDENYKKGTDTDIVKISDMFNMYKISEDYLLLNKKQKRELNKRNFNEMVSTHIFLKKFYKPREERQIILDKYSVQCMRNVIVGFVLKDNEIIEENDEN